MKYIANIRTVQILVSEIPKDTEIELIHKLAFFRFVMSTTEDLILGQIAQSGYHIADVRLTTMIAQRCATRYKDHFRKFMIKLLRESSSKAIDNLLCDILEEHSTKKN